MHSNIVTIGKRITRIPQRAALLVIRGYQKTLSPDHGILKARFPYGYCQFHPTCSEYGYQAVERHGFLYGGVLTLGRILRCHPFSGGGIDPVPERRGQQK